MSTDAASRHVIKRPGIGVAVDPAKLVLYRSSVLLNRLELAEATKKVDPDGKGISRDAIAKIENGERQRPKIRTMRLILDALNVELKRRKRRQIQIEDLAPDNPGELASTA